MLDQAYYDRYFGPLSGSPTEGNAPIEAGKSPSGLKQSERLYKEMAARTKEDIGSLPIVGPTISKGLELLGSQPVEEATGTISGFLGAPMGGFFRVPMAERAIEKFGKEIGPIRQAMEAGQQALGKRGSQLLGEVPVGLMEGGEVARKSPEGVTIVRDALTGLGKKVAGVGEEAIEGRPYIQMVRTGKSILQDWADEGFQGNIFDLFKRLAKHEGTHAIGKLDPEIQLVLMKHYDRVPGEIKELLIKRGIRNPATELVAGMAEIFEPTIAQLPKGIAFKGGSESARSAVDFSKKFPELAQSLWKEYVELLQNPNPAFKNLTFKQFSDMYKDVFPTLMGESPEVGRILSQASKLKGAEAAFTTKDIQELRRLESEKTVAMGKGSRQGKDVGKTTEPVTGKILSPAEKANEPAMLKVKASKDADLELVRQAQRHMSPLQFKEWKKRFYPGVNPKLE